MGWSAGGTRCAGSSARDDLAGQAGDRELEHIILDAFPVGTRADIGRLIYSAVKHPKTLGFAYLLALLWSCSALFSCVGGALNAMHGVTGRHVIKQRLMGLRLSPALLGTIVFLVALETVTDRLPKTPIIGLSAAGIVLTFLIAFIWPISTTIVVSAVAGRRKVTRRYGGLRSSARPVP
jgi:uncharacterized BrkB/YihY/UPF0761 family membrane protein